MNPEIQSIIQDMEEVFCGNPWYGKAVLTLLDEIDSSKVYIKANGISHSLIELLYHMLTWQEYTQHQLENKLDLSTYQLLDWTETNPEIHTWNTGIAELKASHNKIINLLQDAPDDLLEKEVQFKKFSTRVLLHGMIQHNIYHIGQIAYVNKLLS